MSSDFYAKCDKCGLLVSSTVENNPVKDGEYHAHCGGRLWVQGVHVPGAAAGQDDGPAEDAGAMYPAGGGASLPRSDGSTVALYNQDPEKGAVKDDSKKVLVELVPPEGIWGPARVFTHGAKKYGPRNWEKGLSRMRLLGSTMRHLMAMTFGQKLDPETHMPHSWHLGCNVMMYIALEQRGHFTEETNPLDGLASIEMLENQGDDKC